MDPYDYLDSDYEEFLRKEDKKMDSQKFIDKCKEIVLNYANEHLDKSDQKEITEKDVFVVWSCKT
ncbi:hypothetical protein HKH47_002745, partial [Enterococcus faecalis]|nr:hypothetical protein [Enterococcus faecalis]